MKKYSMYIIIAVVLVVAVGGYFWYQNEQKKKRRKPRASAPAPKSTSITGIEALDNALPESTKQSILQGKDAIINAK